MRSNTKALKYHSKQGWIEWITLALLLVFSKIIVWIFRPSPSQTSRSIQSVGTILVVGDDIAFGYGDNLKSTLGISDYLPLYLLKERKLRTNWKVYNVGYHGSCSRDWMPDSRSGYFNKLKSRIIDNNSTILLLFIGSNDYLYGITDIESIHNLKIICKELENIGVVTFISTLPTWGDEGMHQDKITTRLELNKSIKEMVGFKEIEGLMNGVDLDASNFEYRVLNLYISDGMHFSKAVRNYKFKKV
jgi:hypothetical protein